MLFAVLSLPLCASLSLTIDPDTETLWFSGTDSGDSLDITGGSGLLEIVTWQFGTSSGANETFSVAGGFSTTFFNAAELTVTDAVPDGIRLALSNDDGPPATSITSITANDNPISYATLPIAHKNILAGLDGEQMALDQGSGYSPIAISVVPEPTTFAMLALALVGLYRLAARRVSA